MVGGARLWNCRRMSRWLATARFSNVSRPLRGFCWCAVCGPASWYVHQLRRMSTRDGRGAARDGKRKADDQAGQEAAAAKAARVALEEKIRALEARNQAYAAEVQRYAESKRLLEAKLAEVRRRPYLAHFPCARPPACGWPRGGARGRSLRRASLPASSGLRPRGGSAHEGDRCPSYTVLVRCTHAPPLATSEAPRSRGGGSNFARARWRLWGASDRRGPMRALPPRVSTLALLVASQETAERKLAEAECGRLREAFHVGDWDAFGGIDMLASALRESLMAMAHRDIGDRVANSLDRCVTFGNDPSKACQLRLHGVPPFRSVSRASPSPPLTALCLDRLVGAGWRRSTPTPTWIAGRTRLACLRWSSF